MKKSILLILNLLLSTNLILTAQNFNPGDGILKIKISDFPYFNDGGRGMDYRSYGQLGDVGTYIVKIIPATRMKDIRKTQKEFQASTGISTFSMIDNIFAGSVSIKSARACMEPENKALFLKKFREDKGIIFYFPERYLPPYIEIPLPSGEYYIEYCIEFINPRISSFKYCHPNYKGKGASGIRWGPPKIRINKGLTNEIQFIPTNNLCGYRYFENDPLRFQESPVFWDYLAYLVWLGEI